MITVPVDLFFLTASLGILFGAILISFVDNDLGELYKELYEEACESRLQLAKKACAMSERYNELLDKYQDLREKHFRLSGKTHA